MTSLFLAAKHVAKCKAMVDLVLSGEADDIFLKPGEIKKDDFSVPRAAVGTIIGQKGAKIRELEGHAAQIGSVAACAAGVIAAGAADGRLLVWVAIDGEVV